MRNKYDEEKRVLEEYRLKMGGLLKYVTDEYEFINWNREREQYILEWCRNYLSHLSNASEELRFEKLDIELQKDFRAHIETGTAGTPPEDESGSMPPLPLTARP